MSAEEIRACIRAALQAKYGPNLPTDILTLGDRETGWYLVHNNCGDRVDFGVHGTSYIKYRTWPAGLVDNFGAVIYARHLKEATAESFYQWLKGSALEAA